MASHRLLSFGPADWREGLPYPEDAALIGLDRLRLVDDAPTAIHRSVIDAERRGPYRVDAEASRQRRGFHSIVFSIGAGLIIARGVETLRARAATTEEARLLKIGDAPLSWRCTAKR